MALTTTLTKDEIGEKRDVFAEKLGESLVGGMEIGTCYIGHQLGYYRALAEAGELTAPELARRTGTHRRYAREWLEQQTVAGVLSASNTELDADERLFSIPPGHHEVLLDIDSLTYMPGAMRMLVAMLRQMPNVVEAFRTGGGVPYENYGPDLVEGLDEENRAGARQLLGKRWIPEMPDIHHRLLSDPPASVADIGCGAGGRRLRWRSTSRTSASMGSTSTRRRSNWAESVCERKASRIAFGSISRTPLRSSPRASMTSSCRS